MSRRAGRD